jgi:sterol 24-C-methyltransferase
MQRMPFDEDQFDAVYAIEATLHSPSLREVYAQCYKVLKPGGVFGVYEWALTDQFSSTDHHHTAIRLGIERGNGIPSLQTTAHAQDAMKAVGFDLLIVEDLATRDDPLGWWNPLTGNLKTARGWYDWLLVVRNTWWGRPVMRVLIRGLEWMGVAPKGTCTITEDLLIGNDALVAAGEAGIFTPMFLMVAKKP